MNTKSETHLDPDKIDLSAPWVAVDAVGEWPAFLRLIDDPQNDGLRVLYDETVRDWASTDGISCPRDYSEKKDGGAWCIYTDNLWFVDGNEIVAPALDDESQV